MLLTADKTHYLEFEDPSVLAIQTLLSREHPSVMYRPWKSGIEVPYKTTAEILNEEFAHLTVITYSQEIGEEVLRLVPLTRALSLNPFRVSLFVSPPHCYYAPHKDGTVRGVQNVGLNYPIHIHDDLCKTSWFSDTDLECTVNNVSLAIESRNFDRNMHTAVETFGMRNDRAVIVDVGTFHSFDNASPHKRVILTLRPMVNLDFSLAKKRARALCDPGLR